jgi:altronate hydrolase
MKKIITDKENTKAIILNENDNIVIALENMNAGQYLKQFALTIDAPILSGQKIAKIDISENSPIYKYGTIIGFADSNILKGQVLTNSNVIFKEFIREHDYCAKYQPTRFVNASSERSFMGFKRDDGRVGTRNYIAVVSTVNCSATVVHEIAAYFTNEKLKNYSNIDGVAAFSHSTGCGMELSGEPMNLLHRTLGGYINHPNVASSLVVGLGCERCQVGGLFQSQGIAETNKLRTLVMQENGGTTATIKAGIKCIQGMLEEANKIERIATPLSSLMVGLQCGGSDAFSSLSANPALGKAVDILVAHGGTAILSETPEIYGVENSLTARAINSNVAEKLMDRVNWWKDIYSVGRDVQINGTVSPGNQKGGLANILEKSLGSAMKGGTTGLMEVYNYAEKVDKKGFVFMDTPGFDPVSATGQIAGGANLIAFTTGRGSCFGAKPTPSIKLATNSNLYERMNEDMDINCGAVIDGEKNIEEMGKEIFEEFISFASGKKTKSEVLNLGRHEFAPWQIGITG